MPYKIINKYSFIMINVFFLKKVKFKTHVILELLLGIVHYVVDFLKMNLPALHKKPNVE